MEIPSSSSFLSLLKDSLTTDFDPSQSSKEEVELINNLDNYFKMTVREVMVPRTKMITIDKNSSVADAIELIITKGFSRIPVRDKRIDDIVGVVHGTDLFPYYDKERDVPLIEIMHKPHFVSYSQPIHNLLNYFKKKHAHLALVVDEYGGVDGVITIMDIMGELVGDITDIGTDLPQFEEIENRVVIMDASYPLDDFNKLYETGFLKDGIETIGGYICHVAKKIPKKGDQIKIAPINFTVEDSDDRKLVKLRLSAPDKVG
ncbi:MAG: HlyC/CorC family transporter [Proteobacteria bacterium]|nr:HlyC/CorC family transporter [Pseudomonadota bacterium]